MSPSSIVELPNGISPRLVLLGDSLERPDDVGTYKWWSSALSEKVRSKLMRRIVSEGLVLPNVFALTLAMVSEIYTTTAVAKGEEAKFQVPGRRRVRLSCNHSPITDIGIVHGSARVTNQDRLAYYDFENDQLLMGQDPDDHYWMYLKTLAGNEYFLDCGTMNFNFCIMVNVSKHWEAMRIIVVGFAPAFFYSKEHEKVMPLIEQTLLRPRKKVSILRESRLHKFISSFETEPCECHDIPVIRTILDDISGPDRRCTQFELDMAVKFIPHAIRAIRGIILGRLYVKFLKEPGITIDLDREEEDRDSTGTKAEELFKFLNK